MTQLIVQSLDVTLNNNSILRDINLELAAGSIGCLLGPSGCGKTTLLRTIAGFIPPSQGEIQLQGRIVSKASRCLPVEKRHVGMVFQDFALFPHLNVRQNIAFGLANSKSHTAQQRVDELLELTNLIERAEAFPHQLSGGQQQRVALARALAPRPSLLLLDEPFSSIDSELRESLAHRVRDILKAENVTAMLVTHDQLEAFAMADEIGVMQQGELRQWDTAYDLYHQPNSRFVADFIGEGGFIKGHVINAHQIETILGTFTDHKQDFQRWEKQTVDVLIRPDDIVHDDDASLHATVKQKNFRGAEFIYKLALKNGEEILCYAPSHHNHAINEPIGITVDMDHIVAFPQQ